MQCRSLFNFFRILLLLFGMFGLTGCQNNDPSKRGNANAEVLVSIPPYAYFVKKIAGDAVKVKSIIPPGSDLHTFEPTAKDVSGFQQATLWIGIGETFEKRIVQTLQAQNRDITILNLSEFIPLSPDPSTLNPCSGHGGNAKVKHSAMDLHFWLSPKLAPLQAQLITRALIEANPEEKSRYLANLKNFLRELRSMDNQIDSLLSPIKGSTILVSHPSLGYFCKDYGLYQISVECEGKAPKPKDLQEILEIAKDRKVKCLIMQTNLPYKGAKMIADRLQIATYNFDPYIQNYPDNLIDLAKEISKNYRSSAQ